MTTARKSSRRHSLISRQYLSKTRTTDKEPQIVGDMEEKEPYGRRYAQGSRGYEPVNRRIGASLLKRFRKRIYVAVTVIAIIITVAVLVAVVEVKDHKSLKSTSSHTSTASPNTSTSTSGAYNGTGLSVLCTIASSLQVVLFY